MHAFAQNRQNIQWEYTAFDTNYTELDAVIEEANKLGREGWELVANDSGYGNRLIFKRRLP
jgi:hypothetical protein